MSSATLTEVFIGLLGWVMFSKACPVGLRYGVHITAGADRDQWEYLIVGLSEFEHARTEQGGSVAVSKLNLEGAEGWEAVAMTPMAGGGFAVLLKRRL